MLKDEKPTQIRAEEKAFVLTNIRSDDKAFGDGERTCGINVNIDRIN